MDIVVWILVCVSAAGSSVLGMIYEKNKSQKLYEWVKWSVIITLILLVIAVFLPPRPNYNGYIENEKITESRVY